MVAESIAEANTITDRSITALTTIDVKNRRTNEVYGSNDKWIEENVYENNKVRHVCREHMFPDLKFVIGERQTHKQRS